MNQGSGERRIRLCTEASAGEFGMKGTERY